jgi:formylglycine-generating enzyme required for sulfatase activity
MAKFKKPLKTNPMRETSPILCYVLVFFLFFLVSSPVLANNLSVSNVSLEDRDPSSDTVVVNFNISWENSWRTKINHDAVWLTVRLFNPSQSPSSKSLCSISASGINPAGSSVGSNTALEFYAPADKKGAFLRPTQYGVNSAVSSTSAKLKIDYSSCGFGDNDSVQASVSAFEMVYVPKGSFYVGDNASSAATLVQGSADNDPWVISSESAINVANPASDGFRYVSAGQAGEDASGSAFSIPAAFPKGFNGFYSMKYEINEGQWVEFVNSIGSVNGRVNRDLTDSNHKNSDSVKSRNTISCSGSPLVCTTSRPARAVAFLSWMDLAAFLDWAALRPMTELEFEKMARGPFLPLEGEFAWGTTAITAAAIVSGADENGTETITTTNANAHFNNIVLTGGDSASGAEHTQGPLRNGIFASSSATRQTSGAGYYGVMELSGNVTERVVTIGNVSGRAFTGNHGDGLITTVSGYEGNADVALWPGLDAVVTRGVTGADGSGFRGGAWDDQVSGARLRISDRAEATLTTTANSNATGGRGVRTYDGN